MPIGDKIKAVLGGISAAPASPPPFQTDPDFPRDAHPEMAHAANRAGILDRWITPGGTGAEIGVFWAHFSEHLLDRTHPRKLHLIDGWETVHGPTYPKGDPKWSNKGRLTTAETYAAAHALATKSRAITLHKDDPVATLKGLPEQSLDWAYLDHLTSYTTTRTLLEALLPRMKPTGVILGDDYVWDFSTPRIAIKLAVDEFVAKYGLEFIEQPDYQFALLQGQTPRPS